jgi:hypothetical protein
MTAHHLMSSHPFSGQIARFLFTDHAGLLAANPLDLEWVSGKRELVGLVMMTVYARQLYEELRKRSGDRTLCFGRK